MVIAEMFVLFILYSFLGWVWETIYCSIQNGEFRNRGFLFGPICPIYGCCVVFVQLLCRYGKGIVSAEAPVWRTFLICAVGSAVAEYATSWYLEKRFHARWWDYSKIPLNLNGRIALPISLCFGAAGVLIVRYLLPSLSHAGGFVHPLVWEALSLILMGVFAADFALTEAALNSLLQRIETMENEFNTRAQSAYEAVAEKPQQISAKVKGIEEEFRSRVSSAASGLTAGQKHIMENIRSFRPVKKRRYTLHAGQKLKEALAEAKLRRKKTADGKQS